MHPFVNLDPERDIDVIVAELRRLALRDADSISALLHAGLDEYVHESWFDSFLSVLGQRLVRNSVAFQTKDAAMLGSAAMAIACRDAAWTIDFAKLRPALVEHLAAMELDLNEAFVAVMSTSEIGAALISSNLIADLVDRALIDPSRFIDRTQLRSATSSRGRHWNNAKLERDPTCLEYWCKHTLDRIIPTCIKLVETEPLETIGALARGICYSLSLARNGIPAVDVLPLLELLCNRRRLERPVDDPILTKACWNLAAELGANAASCLVEDYVDLQRLALDTLGKMRVLCEDGSERFLAEQEHLQSALFFLLETQPSSSIWEVVKRLLLTLRRVPALCVPPDLSTTSNQPQLAPWSWVPERIAWVFDRYLAREIALDPTLDALRTHFAKFCLDRIKTRERGSAEFVEPDPYWRYGYVHAARELHAGLGARGHRVLVWSRMNDPEERVRQAAEFAEDIVRREQGLPKDVSPRRALYAAFWWLRQAHVLALAGHVHDESSHETFRKEIRRQHTTSR